MSELIKPIGEDRATTKNNENQSVCDRFPIVYLLYWNFLPRLGKLLNTRWLLERQQTRAPNDARSHHAQAVSGLRVVGLGRVVSPVPVCPRRTGSPSAPFPLVRVVRD